MVKVLKEMAGSMLVLMLGVSMFAVEISSTKSKMQSMCMAAKKLNTAYTQNCLATAATTGTAGGAQDAIRPLCLVERDPANTARIPKSQQTDNLRRFRSLPVEIYDDVCVESGYKIDNIMRVLQRAMDYMNETLSDINTAETIIATRTLQAQLTLCIENLRGSPNIALFDQLNELKDRAREMSEVLSEYVIPQWPTFSMREKMMMGTFFWRTPAWGDWKSYDVLASGDRPLQPVDAFDHYVPNSHPLVAICPNNMAKDCSFEPECVKMIMNPSAAMNTLTHNILFINFAERLNCLKSPLFVEKFPNGDYNAVNEDMCWRTWNEANQIWLAGFPQGYKALFSFETTICTMAGYPNFQRWDWMKAMVDWFDSSKSGCALLDGPFQKITVDKFSDDVHHPNGEDCSNYVTATAFQALAMHLRFIVENCYTKD